MLPGTGECHIYRTALYGSFPSRTEIMVLPGKLPQSAVLYIYIWHSPVPGNIFHSDFPFFRLSLTALNFCGNGISSKFKKPVFIHIMTTFKTQKSSPETFFMGAHRTPKVGCFFLFSKIRHSCCRYISACTKATAIFFIKGDRRYPPV